MSEGRTDRSLLMFNSRGLSCCSVYVLISPYRTCLRGVESHESRRWEVRDNTDIMQHERLVSTHHSQSLGTGDDDCRRIKVFKLFKNLLRGKFSPWVKTRFRPECYTKITCSHIIYLHRRIP